MEILRNRNIWLILAFSILAVIVMGYHPGIEDDGVYLSAVKGDLNPALYPHDAEFFRVQLQATMFDKWVAGFIQVTHIPVSVAEFLWQFATIILTMVGCWSIARCLFADKCAQWGGVAMVAAMLTLPVAGTALYLADQHLHPRNLSTAIILIAVSRIMNGKHWQAVPLLLLSVVLHPIMAVLGISFCVFLTVATLEPVHAWLRSLRDSLAAAVPLGWIFESPTPVWRKALETRSYFFLYRWTWYEWLGAIAPLFLFWLLWRIAEKRGETQLSRFALAVFAYGVFQQVAAMVVLGSPGLVRITPMQPMRYLHLIYFFMALVAGSLLTKFVVKTSIWRWATYLLVINVGMFATQRAMFASSPHLELPGVRSSNSWLQAFRWIRKNTPTDAYFAMDPNYLAAPGEDYHSFRALAERSQLADAIKDTAVVTQVPELGPTWERQVTAQAGWTHFKLADFERLKSEFGVNWALVSYPQPPGLECRWHNSELSVCQIP
ncbi:MAG TPA: DUF6798 domain-containing protein [Terracidiphilus sp.]|nr:DUF6798 domain-containing protein [Terracidiphilus sp.]